MPGSRLKAMIAGILKPITGTDLGGGKIALDTNPAAFDSDFDSISSVPLFFVDEYNSSDITDDVITVSEAVNSVDIDNYGNSDITMTINSKAVTIKAHTVYNDLCFETPFTVITMSAGAANFLIHAKKRGQVT